MKNFKKIGFTFFGCLFFLSITAQTFGTLNFTFSSIAQVSNHGTKNNLAVWIQKDDGSFVKTQFRFAGDLTRDHLPIWAVNSGGPASDCLDSSCNVVNAVTGATLLDYGLQSFTWDGTDTAGVLVEDGVYRVMIEECWKHGTDGLTSRVYSFVKGPNTDSQSIISDTCFTGISLEWLPTNSLEDNNATHLSVYSNPSQSGIFHLEFDNAKKIVVTNLSGQILLSDEVKSGEKTKEIDLSKYGVGTYYLLFTDDNSTRKTTLISFK